ncbi:hypothetical protein U0C82_01255 [Fulvimarina sp. 2208YS6-2-32]|uniref:Uncharacterized protein n=1 Tax=Fulvimarina uroteuthidis TaxID=3098149 RepID=A0ABU5HXB2_9HYPH|nr:hypothetical protein [Fulvimarina sp. 2208YS6-2-32]
MIERLCEFSNLAEATAAECLGEQGILPALAEPFVDGSFRDLSGVNFIGEGTRGEIRFLEPFEEILPAIADVLADRVENLCRVDGRHEAARRAFMVEVDKINRHGLSKDA